MPGKNHVNGLNSRKSLADSVHREINSDSKKTMTQLDFTHDDSSDANVSDGNIVESSTLQEPQDEQELIQLKKELLELGLDEGIDGSRCSQSNEIGRVQDRSKADAEIVWQNALAELALGMPPATFDTWMRDTQVLGYEDGEFIIGVPNAYACDWIKNRLRSQIKRTLTRLLTRSVQVTLRVAPLSVVDGPQARPAPLYDTILSNADEELSQDEVLADRTDANGFYANKTESFDNRDHDDVPSLKSPPILQSSSVTERNGASPSFSNESANYHNNAVGSIELNGSHTFESFVVGNHNRLAHAAATAISEKPGSSFNPLFIYGGVGLGKTHLLHAIGNVARRNSFRVLYCTSEQFTNELILSIRSQSTEAFRNKYRQVDFLLIDDIQFIGGKESTQEEFFHTFNHLHAAGRQVVLSSDRPPKALATLEERLCSRFEGGLQTDISRPDFETRVAILQSKAGKTGMNIEQAVLMMIAERVDSNIRELEGALNRIVLHAKLFSSTLDVSLAESVLRNLAPERTLRTPATVIQIVAEYFSFSEEVLKSKTRTKEIAHARQVAMYLLREENALSLPSIGDYLGGRDHSTVRHGVEKISNGIEEDETIRHQIMALRERIYAAPGLDT